MGLETGTFIDDLNSSNPIGTDGSDAGDNHLRLIKSVLKNTFKGAVRAFQFPTAPAAKTAAYTVLSTDENALIRGDASSGAFDITLPLGSSIGFTNFKVTIMKSDSSSNAITGKPSGSDTINGASSTTFATQYLSKTFAWDGTEWKIISESAQAITAASAPTIFAMTGEIKMWTTVSAPTGWLFCDGSEVSQTTYAALYAAIGADAFGTDAGGNFFLPDFRGRIPVGVGTGDAGNATAFTLADKDGDEIHVLTESELAAHTHLMGAFSTTAAGGGGTFNYLRDTAGFVDASDSTGSDSGHTNLQPSLAIEFIIKT